MSTPPIHYSDWAQQPDVGIYCDEKLWVIPSWTQLSVTGAQLPHDVFVGENSVTPEVLYTFSKDRITCPACKARMETGWTREERR